MRTLIRKKLSVARLEELRAHFVREFEKEIDSILETRVVSDYNDLLADTIRAIDLLIEEGQHEST